MSAPTALLLTVTLAGASIPASEPGPRGCTAVAVYTSGPVQAEVPFGHSLTIDSRHLGEAREVFIRLPKGYVDQAGPGAARYPVLYLLDGDDYFQPFAGVVEYLDMYEAVPPMIVVAVPHADRMRELTFTPANEEYGDWPSSGGAEHFERFLEEELIPAIDARYRTYQFRILAGHSLGGLFAIESMSRNPDLFQATIAISPSFTWNQYEWLDQAASMFEGMPSWKHFLFVTEEPKSDEHVRKVEELGEMISARAPAGFEYWHEDFPDENHGTVGLPGFYYSLKRLFDGWALLGEAWQIGPERVLAHFGRLADKYGFDVPIPEDYLVDHALHGLHRHEAPDEAIALLELCLSLYPDSAAAHEALGQAYERKGDAEAAEAHRLQALELDSLTVWYMGHDGFAVQSGEKLLVFDYVTEFGTPSANPDASGLADGLIDPADLEGLDVYVFVSHAHGDHYDRAILEWAENVDSITYFLGWKAEDNPDYYYLVGPRATAEIDGIEIFSINSHGDGIPEVAWLVNLDGHWIYHNGDYVEDYEADFEYLREITDHIDIVFLPGVHSPRSQIARMNLALLDEFSPDYLFPMHAGGREHESEEFARVMKERGCEASLLVPTRRGDSWVIGR